jgi:predicted amidohydrolase
MKITAIQMNSINDWQANMDAALELAEAAIEADQPDLIAFPEVMAFQGGRVADRLAAAEDIPGRTSAWLAGLAKKHGVFVHGGSFFERADTKVYNTSLAFGPDGQMLAHYRKIHLFDVTTPQGEDYRESDLVRAGEELVCYPAGELIIGCSICYDLRFAELYRGLVEKGAQLILVPAAFTRETGAAHWELLLRARAIETQCYIMAPAQCGSWPDGSGGERGCWGQSLIIDPWGQIVAEAKDGPGWISAEICADYLHDVRAKFPIASHRRL